jgi:tRNA(Ile2) C34 agmatinyltransferase TiaS
MDLDAEVIDCDCPACGGAAAFLGTLGQREHFRCRACGADFSAEKIPDETDEAAEQEWLRDSGMPSEDEP